MEEVLINKKHTSDLSDEELMAIFKLLKEVNGDEFSVEELSHALGGSHFLAFKEDQLIAHAAVVQRSILLDNKPHKVGYVEAIGVIPEFQHKGVGKSMMQEINQMIDKCYHFDALSPSSESKKLFEEAGWQEMQAPYYEYTLVGIIPSSEKCVMTYSGRIELEAKNKLTCDFRERNAW